MKSEEKQDPSSIPGIIGMWVIVFLVFAYVFGGEHSATATSKVAKPAAQSDGSVRQDDEFLKILSVLAKPVAQPMTEVVKNSGWDGSVRQADKFLKKVLKDPGSLEYIGWTPVSKNATGYEVGVSYRAKNSFGGYCIENKLFKFDNLGNVISCD